MARICMRSSILSPPRRGSNKDQTGNAIAVYGFTMAR